MKGPPFQKLPPDWDLLLSQAAEDRDAMAQATLKAGHWPTCAVGEALLQRPEAAWAFGVVHGDVAPLDGILSILGYQFLEDLEDGDLRAAQQKLGAIRDRVEKLATAPVAGSVARAYGYEPLDPEAVREARKRWAAPREG